MPQEFPRRQNKSGLMKYIKTNIISFRKNYTDVTMNAYIGLLLCSTHIDKMQLHIEMTR